MSPREDILSLAVPEGWKLVPIEPTENQVYEGLDANETDWTDDTDDHFPRIVAKSVYRAMVAVAPTPPAAEAPGQEPVAVKPLEWVERFDLPGLHNAESPIGWWYNVRVLGEGRVEYDGDPVLGPRINVREFETLVAAQAAAQADYEQRIRSALVAAPPTYADAEAKGDGWHDISSAPRDGTTVDLWADGCRRVDFYCDKHGRWTRKEGYPAVWRVLTIEPTHWRPRPAEPAAIRSLASPAPKGET